VRVAVTGVGLVTALGTDPAQVARALEAGRTGVGPAGDERDLLPVPGFARVDLDVRPLLKRRKDRKLLPRAAELASAAAFGALGEERPDDVGLYLGVGREPADEGETERALVAGLVDGRFDADRFGREGLPHYPPLASLRTLPNLVLAHTAIQLDLTGEGGTRAGAEAAGLAAVVEGARVVAEGRSEVVLAGGADSLVDAASARDLVRLGRAGPHTAPGEAAAVLRLESLDRAERLGATVLAVLVDGGTSAGGQCGWTPHWVAGLGSCGAASAVVELALDLAGDGGGHLDVVEARGASAWLRWERVPRDTVATSEDGAP